MVTEGRLFLTEAALAERHRGGSYPASFAEVERAVAEVCSPLANQGKVADSMSESMPFAFHDLPKEKFPVDLYAFSPKGKLVWHRHVLPYVVVDIPGTGPGSVRYIVSICGDGSAFVYDKENPETA